MSWEQVGEFPNGRRLTRESQALLVLANVLEKPFIHVDDIAFQQLEIRLFPRENVSEIDLEQVCCFGLAATLDLDTLPRASLIQSSGARERL